MDLRDSRNPIIRPLRNALRAFFVPLAYLLQRFCVSYQDVCDGLLQGYIEAARERLQAAGEKPTHSRIALLSGVTRQRIAAHLVLDKESRERPMPLSIIIDSWRSRHSDDQGNPLDLPLRGPGSFAQLVKSCTSSFTARTALDELEAGANVEVQPDNTVRLVNTTIIPTNEIELAAVAIQNITFHLESIRRNMEWPGKGVHERFVYSWQIPAYRAPGAVKEMQRVASGANREAEKALGALESDNPIEQDTVGLGTYVYHKPK